MGWCDLDVGLEGFGDCCYWSVGYREEWEIKGDGCCTWDEGEGFVDWVCEVLELCMSEGVGVGWVVGGMIDD